MPSGGGLGCSYCGIGGRTPIVFHAGPDRWTTHRTLADLFDPLMTPFLQSNCEKSRAPNEHARSIRQLLAARCSRERVDYTCRQCYVV